MGVFSAVESLRERGITLKGEQYYAVIVAYLEKINALENSSDEKLDALNLLRQAGKANVLKTEAEKSALNSEFQAVLNDFSKLFGKNNEWMSECMKETLTNANVSQEGGVTYLHNLATHMQFKNNNVDLKVLSRRVSNADSQLNSAKERYDQNYKEYRTVTEIEYDDKALKEFFHKQAPSCKLSDDMKKNMIKSAAEIEDKFLSDFQSTYIAKAVDFAVDNECLYKVAEAQESRAATEAFA